MRNVIRWYRSLWQAYFGSRSKLPNIGFGSSVATLSLAIAACTPAEGYRKYANAVGPSLYAASTADNSRLLEVYTSHLCYQASLPMAKGREGLDWICAFDKFSNSSHWMSFVQMGLFDIDRRCDAFLESLYYKEKSRSPILNQIRHSGTVTREILEITAPSSRAIRIVAAAFDFAENSFTNVRDGLLEALDQTTVKTIVYGRQKTVKEEIASLTFNNKPAALHALRAYLRVCMPFTIEMEANAALVSVQRNNGQAGDSLISAATADVKPFKPGDEFNPPDRPGSAYDEAKKIFKNAAGYHKPDVVEFQARICSMPDGTVGSGTKLAILLAEDIIHMSDASKFDGLLDETEVSTIRGWSNECDHEKYIGRFELEADTDVALLKTPLIDALKILYPEDDTVDFESVTSPEARKLYEKAHNDGKVEPLAGVPKNVLSRHLHDQILKASKK